jgi:serine/threonine-protein kinase
MGFGAGITESAIAKAEHVANVLRMRKAALVGMVAWPLFGIVDWFVVAFVHTGRLWYYLTLRAVGLLWIALATARIHARPMVSPRLLRFMEVSIFAAVSALISATCLEFRGIASPLAMGVITVLVCRAAVMSEPWRRALLPVGLIVGGYPAVMGLLALVVPEIAVQFRDKEALATFVLNVLFIAGAGAIVVMGGHLFWRIRRQVFEIRTLGRYRLKQRIGKGAAGEVWSAEHRILSREVAVKIIRPTQGDDRAVARFEREVQATAALTHPNTVRVFDFGVTEDGLCYYAMELLRGRDLSQILKREQKLAAARAAGLVRQTALALAEAHALGIVHRDLKPSNLFVTSAAGMDEMVKVLDFGLARVVRRGDPTLTQDGWAVGTPTYMSPEVLRGEQATACSDIYAMGAILYHLLCGVPPFKADDMYKVMLAHLNDPPQRLSERIEERVPEALEQLVMRCLHKEPAKRVGSAKSLADMLERYMV